MQLVAFSALKQVMPSSKPPSHSTTDTPDARSMVVEVPPRARQNAACPFVFSSKVGPDWFRITIVSPLGSSATTGVTLAPVVSPSPSPGATETTSIPPVGVTLGSSSEPAELLK